MPNPSAKIDLVAETQKFTSGMNQTQRVLGKVKARMEGVSRAAKVLLVGEVALLGKLIQLAAKQEEEEAKLAAVLKATGGAAELSAKQLKRHAAELQKITGVGDEVIINAQAMLATFKEIKGDTFKAATVLILDMSKALGTDLKSSALQVGKALNDPILGVTALNRAGVQFTEKQKDMIKGLQESGQLQKAQAIILKELKDQFGGVAEAMGNTTSGQLSKFTSALGDLGEVIGATVIPPFISLVKTITGSLGLIIDWVKENETLVEVMIIAGLTITGLLASYTLLGTSIAAITALSGFASGGIATLTAAMSALGISANLTSASLLAFLTNPVVLAVAALTAAIALSIAELAKMNAALKEQEERSKKSAASLGRLTKAVGFADRIKELKEIIKFEDEEAKRFDKLHEDTQTFTGRLANINLGKITGEKPRDPKLFSDAAEQARIRKARRENEVRDLEAALAKGLTGIPEDKSAKATGKPTKDLDKKLAALQLEFNVLGKNAEATDRLKLAAAGYNAEQIESIIQLKNKIRAEEEAIGASDKSADKIKASTERIRERREELEKEVLALKQGLTDDQIELIDLESLGVAKDEIKRITELLAKRKALNIDKQLDKEAESLKRQLLTQKELLAEEKKRLDIQVKRGGISGKERDELLKRFKDQQQGSKTASPSGGGAPAFQGVSAAFQRIADAAGSRTGKKPEEETAKNTKKTADESTKQTMTLADLVKSVRQTGAETVDAIKNLNPNATLA